MSDLYRLGLVEVLDAIAADRVAVVDYVDSCIARTIAVEPEVGAFVHFDADTAREAAARAPAGRALSGMPVGIKDIIATRGVPTEMGSAAFVGNVPGHSASVIDALESAGGFVFGKTVTTEFAWRHPGKTRNPWQLDRTPGGSSSGSAAAVASGCVPAALGTQTLGSVLRPAAYCGVVGYKPSFGSIPRTGAYELAPSFDHIGVFTRSVIDAALIASALTLRDGIDLPWLAPLAPAWPLTPSSAAPRIALLRTSAWDRVSGEQQALIGSVADRLAAAGASVTSIELPPPFDAVWDIAKTIVDAEGSEVNARFALESPPRVSQPTLDLVARGRLVSSADYLAAKRTQQALMLAFARAMQSFDVVLTTPALGEAPPGLHDTGDAVFCTPFAVMGSPAISLPAGRAASGLPLGVQLAAPWGRDLALLQAASWIERVLEWQQGFPTLPAH